MKKLYNINGNEFGIDFDSVLCFYIDGEIDTYNGKCCKYLNILIGSEIGHPNKIINEYSRYNYEKLEKPVGNIQYVAKETINKDVDKLYQDLIEYFKNENKK